MVLSAMQAEEPPDDGDSQFSNFHRVPTLLAKGHSVNRVWDWIIKKDSFSGYINQHFSYLEKLAVIFTNCEGVDKKEVKQLIEARLMQLWRAGGGSNNPGMVKSASAGFIHSLEEKGIL